MDDEKLFCSSSNHHRTSILAKSLVNLIWILGNPDERIWEIQMKIQMSEWDCTAVRGWQAAGIRVEPRLQISEFEFCSFPFKFLTQQAAAASWTTVIGKGTQSVLNIYLAAFYSYFWPFHIFGPLSKVTCLGGTVSVWTCITWSSFEAHLIEILDRSRWTWTWTQLEFRGW